MATEVDTGPPTATTIEGISEGIDPFYKIKKSRASAGYIVNPTPARQPLFFSTHPRNSLHESVS